jgi:hypothetical protein
LNLLGPPVCAVQPWEPLSDSSGAVAGALNENVTDRHRFVSTAIRTVLLLQSLTGRLSFTFG